MRGFTRRDFREHRPAPSQTPHIGLASLYKFYLSFYGQKQQSSTLKDEFINSVVDPDPGFGAFLTPGSGIRNRFFPDLGSRIPDLGFRIPGPKPILLRAK